MLLRSRLAHKRAQFSPLMPDFTRVVLQGKDGIETISYKLTDFAAIDALNGTEDLWQLQTMLQAGVQPGNIHTSPNERLSLEEQAIAFENQLNDVETELKNFNVSEPITE